MWKIYVPFIYEVISQKKEKYNKHMLIIKTTSN